MLPKVIEHNQITAAHVVSVYAIPRENSSFRDQMVTNGDITITSINTIKNKIFFIIIPLPMSNYTCDDNCICNYVKQNN
jgi:hypothetical protein